MMSLNMNENKQVAKKLEDEEDEDLDELISKSNSSSDGQSNYFSVSSCHCQDESISERIAGLSEMFPDGVKSGASCACNFVVAATRGSYWLLRNALWVASASAVILVLPVIFETERAQQHEEQLQQQRQILLGPNAAVTGSGGGSGNLLPAMGMVPPPPTK